MAPLPVVISETALKIFESICAQINERLGAKVLSDFKKNTIKTLELIGNSSIKRLNLILISDKD